MILGYQQPADPAYTLSGTGSAFLTDVRLGDGNPGAITRIQWLSSGSPVIGDYVDLRCEWATEQQIGLACLVGLTCAEGVKIVLTGRRQIDAGFTYALSGNSTTQRTVALPDGRVAIWFVLGTGLDDLIGLQARIYNDQDSATWATAATTLDVGQFVGWASADLDVSIGWQRSWSDPTVVTRTLGAQIHRHQLRAWRKASWSLAPKNNTTVRARGLTNSIDWEIIEAKMLQANRTGVVVDHLTNGVLDTTKLHRNALFAITVPGPVEHIDANYYKQSYATEEVPSS